MLAAAVCFSIYQINNKASLATIAKENIFFEKMAPVPLGKNIESLGVARQTRKEKSQVLKPSAKHMYSYSYIDTNGKSHVFKTDQQLDYAQVGGKRMYSGKTVRQKRLAEMLNKSL